MTYIKQQSMCSLSSLSIIVFLVPGCGQQQAVPAAPLVRAHLDKHVFAPNESIRLKVTITNNGKQAIRVPRSIQDQLLLTGEDSNGEHLQFQLEVSDEFEGNVEDTALLEPGASLVAEAKDVILSKPGIYKLGVIYVGPESATLGDMWEGSARSDLVAIEIRE